MHTDLSPHLHSTECNDLINQLKECHNLFPVKKFFGYCNTLDSAMVQCLKRERVQRSKENRERAKLKQQKLFERNY